MGQIHHCAQGLRWQIAILQRNKWDAFNVVTNREIRLVTYGPLTYRISFAVFVLATCTAKIRLNVIITSTALAWKWIFTATIPQHCSLHYLYLYCTNYRSLNKYEVHINKQTSTIPQQAQDTDHIYIYIYIYIVCVCVCVCVCTLHSLPCVTVVSNPAKRFLMYIECFLSQNC